MITLKRESAYADRLRAYRVLLDGHEIGEIRDGDNTSLKVSKGVHTLQVKISWCSS